MIKEMNIIRIRNNNLNDNTLLYRGKIQGKRTNRRPRGKVPLFPSWTGFVADLRWKSPGRISSSESTPTRNQSEASKNLTNKSNQLLLLICFIM